MIKLFLAWRNPKTRTWTPIGILEYKNDLYYFQYTKGAEDKDFQTLGQMTDLRQTYTSDSLFPIFKNRLLAKSRPEYGDYLDWLDINDNETNDLLELARSGGIRATDDLQLFPLPEKTNDGKYEVLFFSHGLSHISEDYIKRLNSLKQNDTLLVMKDIQNTSDSNVLVLRTKDDPIEILGFCPAFFINDFNKLLKLNTNKNVHVYIQKINLYAPSQLKLLCKFSTNWPNSFTAFNNKVFLPYSDNKTE